ncbi:MAG: DNA polymerase III subunit delta [Spirochaetales bacterium]|nr:DNA polymerase III subunit delta [Spirochaetales bacterium]
MADTPVYLLLGPENGEKDEFISSLKTAAEKASGEAPEIHRFYPFDTQMADVISIMRNGSLFASSKFVIIQQVEDIKQSEGKLLGEYCANPSDGVTLVLVSDTASASQISSHITKAVPKSRTRIFWEMFENKKQGWITSFFRSKQMGIEPEALSLLLDLVENNTRDFKVACEALSSHYGPGRELTEEDIESFVFHSREENVFTLFDKIAAGDLSGALEIVSKILLSGDNNPVGIIGGLVFQFKRLLNYSRLIDAHYATQEALAKADIRGKRNEAMYARAQRRYTTSDLEGILCRLADCDTALRSEASALHRTYLETFIYTVIVKKGEPLSVRIEV